MIDVSNSLSDEIRDCFGDRVTIAGPGSGMVTIQVPVDEWLEVAQTLRDDPRFTFSQLTDLCGVDFLGYGH